VLDEQQRIGARATFVAVNQAFLRGERSTITQAPKIDDVKLPHLFYSPA
jgi:hypothetical protein